MLLKLSISNFAIIKKIVFEPVPGLNIITGETGAGKSIILDALNLILGERADIKTQSEWGGKCIVEGEFALDSENYKAIFNELDIDFEEVCIIRREINENGKSRTFINDTPVSLQQLRSLTNTLVSLHSQHENSILGEREFQFGLIDSYSGLGDKLNQYRSGYFNLRSINNKLNTLKEQQEKMLREKDYISFLLNEFEQAGLKNNEEDILESEQSVLMNAEQVNEICGQLEMMLTESEHSMVDQLNNIRNRFKSIEHIHPLASEIALRLNSALIELKDISSESSGFRESIQDDPNKLELIQERLNLIQNLKRKHAVNSFSELEQVHEHLADQLINMGDLDKKIEELETSLQKLHVQLFKEASAIHAQRLAHSVKLKIELEKRLRNLELPNAKLEFDMNETKELNEYGSTNIQMRFTANLGMPLQSLNKVASGGELSRLALCIRSLEGSYKKLNTLVFDEVDTGVSGKVADTIGKMFRQISEKHQLIAITHLPQVAGYGNAHFIVCKKEEKNTTVSYLKHLDQKERVDELAKMLSGNEATEIARKNAKELLKV